MMDLQPIFSLLCFPCPFLFVGMWLVAGAEDASPTITKMEGKVRSGLRYHGGRSSLPEKKPKM